MLLFDKMLGTMTVFLCSQFGMQLNSMIDNTFWRTDCNDDAVEEQHLF